MTTTKVCSVKGRAEVQRVKVHLFRCMTLRMVRLICVHKLFPVANDYSVVYIVLCWLATLGSR
jgi:hypothetical protein